jgi:hypothetical protein
VALMDSRATMSQSVGQDSGGASVGEEEGCMMYDV